ncbi:MAG: carbon-nitrogen hydrolase family protein [Deltaproteobacteria bacterium]|nr:carbon-nitrogen hydrolase family protein [Deltaproteobacteria bacterium]
MTNPSTPPVFAAVQVNSNDDVGRNLKVCTDLVRAAAAAGAQWVGLPENFAYLGADRDHKIAIAELAEPGSDGPTGPILGAMKNLAQDLKVWLLLGGFPEKSNAQESRIHNTSLLLDPAGTIAARYRKMHLFDVQIPGGEAFCESDVVAPGTEVVVADTPWGGMGLSICYDLRFPELYRALTVGGARLLTCPAAFTQATGKDHWHALLRARAIENQSFVLAPAQWGHHGGKRTSYGHALIVDPWGVVVAECGDHDGFALARLDLEYQDRVRGRLPCLSHRKL